MCVTPALLFALPAIPMTKTRISQLDVLQRKMLRRIVDWRRLDEEPWRDTMHKMSERLAAGERLYTCQPWSQAFARAQWRLIGHLVRAPPMLWARAVCKLNYRPVHDPVSAHRPFRTRGRPHMRWDDHVKYFCVEKFPLAEGRHWSDLLTRENVDSLEDAFIEFLTSAPA